MTAEPVAQRGLFEETWASGEAKNTRAGEPVPRGCAGTPALREVADEQACMIRPSTGLSVRRHTLDTLSSIFWRGLQDPRYSIGAWSRGIRSGKQIIPLLVLYDMVQTLRYICWQAGALTDVVQIGLEAKWVENTALAHAPRNEMHQ